MHKNMVTAVFLIATGLTILTIGVIGILIGIYERFGFTNAIQISGTLFIFLIWLRLTMKAALK